MLARITMEGVVICVCSAHQELSVNAQQGWSCLQTRKRVYVSICKDIHSVTAKRNCTAGWKGMETPPSNNLVDTYFTKLKS